MHYDQNTCNKETHIFDRQINFKWQCSISDQRVTSQNQAFCIHQSARALDIISSLPTSTTRPISVDCRKQCRVARRKQSTSLPGMVNVDLGNGSYSFEGIIVNYPHIFFLTKYYIYIYYLSSLSAP